MKTSPSKSINVSLQSDHSPAEEYHLENQNSMKVLLAMSIGLKTEKGELYNGDHSSTQQYHARYRKKWKPINSDFISEIRRRKVLMGQRATVIFPMNTASALKWLIENPI